MHLIERREFDERIAKVRKKMTREGLDGLIVYSNCKLPGNVQYLSNYAVMAAGYQSIGGTNTIMWGDTLTVLPMDDEPSLITNCPWIAPQIKDVATIEDIHVTFDYAKKILEILDTTAANVGIDGWGIFPAHIYERLKSLSPNTKFKESMIIEEQRMVKSQNEIRLIREAAKLADEGMRMGTDAIEEGKTEIEVCYAIENAMRAGNPYYRGFENTIAALSIVGSGARTAVGGVSPLPTTKRIERGDLVVMDICPEYAGYAGDISRVRVLGNPTKEQKDLYDTVMQMQSECLKMIRAGNKAKDVQDTANRVGRELGYGEYVVPLVTHGVGLEIHERPDAGVEETVYLPNMVVTCEPAVCTPGLGIRIEDLVLITDAGIEILTKSDKRLGLSK